jgi:hypothetical protein
MTSVVVPIAGHSSRFPNLNPKWSLTHPFGHMMVVEAVKGLDLSEVEAIWLIGLEEHDRAFQLKSALSAQFADIGLGDRTEFVLLPERTSSQPESVARGIRQAGITGSIYIKDSDNYFRDRPAGVNAVAGFDLHLLERVNARSKSYFDVNADGFLVNIVEKRIISSRFCAGGYSFRDADEFLDYYDRCAQSGSELYVSGVIYGMILDGIPFTYSDVEGYTDWGTLKEWQTYTSQFSTIFVDLDGVLVLNSAQYTQPYWGTTEGIDDNIAVLNRLHDTGRVHVVITTARHESHRKVTLRQLERCGVKYDSIIFGLPHGKRIVVNDYAPSNPFKSADSINIRRNSTDLKEMLEDSIGMHLDPVLPPDQ